MGDRDRDLAAGCLVNSYFLSLSPCPSSSPFLAFSLSLYLPVTPVCLSRPRRLKKYTIFQDKPQFALAGRRPEVESARSSGRGQGGGRASPLPRRRREILRISVGIPDICEFRAIAFACECAGEKGPTQVGRQRICTYTYDAYICMYVPMLVRENVCACACVSYDCWLVIGLDSMRRSCFCEYVTFSLWRIRFPPVLVRTGRQLPVQALGERGVLVTLTGNRAPKC